MVEILMSVLCFILSMNSRTLLTDFQQSPNTFINTNPKYSSVNLITISKSNITQQIKHYRLLRLHTIIANVFQYLNENKNQRFKDENFHLS